jgi:hypothetical protein
METMMWFFSTITENFGDYDCCCVMVKRVVEPAGVKWEG